MPEEAQRTSERYDSRGRKVLVGLLVAGSLMLVIAVASAVVTMLSIARDTDAVEQTLEAEAAINQLTAQSERIETARRGYIIQPGASFAALIRQTSADVDATMERLGSLVSDNSNQTARLERLRAIDAERDRLNEVLVASSRGQLAALRESDFDSERGVQLIREAREHLDIMMQTESDLLAARNQNQLSSLVQFYITGGLSFALLIALMIAAILVVMRYNRDLTRAQARLRSVNEGLEDAVTARTTELSRANAEIQRFAYIVSHDLRSPLVNVLGFTSELDAARKTLHAYLTKLYDERPELKDQGAWLAVDEDLPEALGFIRTSTEKMDRLINSILELSRQGRRVLRPEPLEMTALAETVSATLKQRADAAGATVSIAPIPDIRSDRMAVEQILSNLIENAIKYLSPERAGEIFVEGRTAGSMVEIDVVDNGRGIAPEDHQRIFDLFRRAGTQDQAGEGIGLANVRALAYRLGGRIRVESELGGGSRFILTLPKTFAEPSA